MPERAADTNSHIGVLTGRSGAVRRPYRNEVDVQGVAGPLVDWALVHQHVLDARKRQRDAGLRYGVAQCVNGGTRVGPLHDVRGVVPGL